MTPSPVLPRLMKTPVAGHPLPQGGEGREFPRSPLETGWLDPQREKGHQPPRIASACAERLSQPDAICFGQGWDGSPLLDSGSLPVVRSADVPPRRPLAIRRKGPQFLPAHSWCCGLPRGCGRVSHPVRVRQCRAGLCRGNTLPASPILRWSVCPRSRRGAG